ncbi:MAG: hypothetical protein PHF79_01170 [Candidatus Pacebacteria bacterium]|nr:hypothetical protein [Candidatus Paceibacterota bacterium]
MMEDQNIRSVKLLWYEKADNWLSIFVLIGCLGVALTLFYIAKQAQDYAQLLKDQNITIVTD